MTCIFFHTEIMSAFRQYGIITTSSKNDSASLSHGTIVQLSYFIYISLFFSSCFFFGGGGGWGLKGLLGCERESQDQTFTNSAKDNKDEGKAKNDY